MSKFASILGLGTKTEATNPVTEPTVETTDDNPTSAIGEGTVTDESTEAYLLEAEINNERQEDPIGFAAAQLSEFKLTPGAQSLLDRALDNVATSTGAGIKEVDARNEILDRAAFIKACGNDLSVAISAIVGVTDPLDAPGAVYSLTFNVLKAAVFIANLDYRRYLDPNADYDLVHYVDKREDSRDPPMGFATREELEFLHMQELYGSDFQSMEDAPACALSDLRLFFQLTIESMGWNPDNVMPFSNTQNPDGTFSPINDPQQALDAAELRSQASRAKKRDARSKLTAAATAKAQELVRSALSRK